MNWTYFLAWLSFSVLLSACASVRGPGDLNAGRHALMNGNYQAERVPKGSVIVMVKANEIPEKFAAWEKAVQAALKEMSAVTDDSSKRAKAQQEFSKVYNQRTEFMIEDRTGFVWVYLQK